MAHCVFMLFMNQAGFLPGFGFAFALFYASRSPISQTRSVSPDSIADVTLRFGAKCDPMPYFEGTVSGP
jgi:hypothetical protein